MRYINKILEPFLRIAAVLTICVITVLPMSAKVHPSEVKFHNEDTDTARITQMLKEAVNIADPSQRVLSIAMQFVGVPYCASTLENNGDERLVVNLDSMDCTTFVETVLALAQTAGEHRTSWRDFVANLEGLRYRGGNLDGYPSRLHYVSDWVVDNSSRGNITEITNRFDESRTQERTLDYMSRHSEQYPALSDSANFAGIKNVEMGYRRHRYYYLPWSVLGNKNVRDRLTRGDVILLTSKINGLDVGHMGFITRDEKNNPVLLHASSKAGCVTVDKLTLMEYLRKNGVPGLRLVRLND